MAKIAEDDSVNLYTDTCGVESKGNPDIPYRTCLRVKEFSVEETQAFRLACRKNNCTIQGAAQIAAAIAAGRMRKSPLY